MLECTCAQAGTNTNHLVASPATPRAVKLKDNISPQHHPELHLELHTTMTSKRVLKFPVNGNESSFVLVQVSPKGSKPLDLKLVGTEGEAPYVCSCES